MSRSHRIYAADALFWALVLSAAVGLGVGAYLVATSGPFAGVMSPCQCRLAGGCSVRWTPEDGVYSDGTEVEEYDGWGRYVGDDPDVPKECRP